MGNEEEVNRSDYEASEDDNVLVQGVSGDENALGYFGYSYYENNLDTLKALAVDGVKPTEETIRSGEYLLSRPLFIYVSTDALKNNKAVKPFVDFYLAQENLDRLVQAAKYVTMPAAWRRRRGPSTRTAPPAPCSTRKASRRAATWRRRSSSRSNCLCRDGSACNIGGPAAEAGPPAFC